MQFLRENKGAVVQAIAARICDELFTGKRVLWLVSGGSNIEIEATVMQKLRNHCTDRLSGLAILPMDERYGAPGHADSNTEALRQAGFDPGVATWVDVLMHNVSFEQTIDFYNEVTAAAIANAGVIVGQFGLGADAHVAGILPGSPATDDTTKTAVGYKWSDYTRLTLTPHALKEVDVAYVPAYGAGKKTALQRLRDNKELLKELPAKLLYDIPEVCVYNETLTEK
jgi:6-phosphogluconolactonase/glucosamine-6-phosphate isomerase/deaminase